MKHKGNQAMLVLEQAESARPVQVSNGLVYQEKNSSLKIKFIMRTKDLLKIIDDLSGGRECLSEEEETEKRISDFIDTLYALCKMGERREAIARALDFFDDLLIDSRFFECVRTIGLLRPEKLAGSVSVSILGITARAKRLLGVARASFYQRALQEITRLKGKKYANELLEKYR